MTVSIIIPHLEDGSGYLRDCLDSINAQAFKDVQIIVEEDTPEKPLGVAAMRNRGLLKAEGDYVLFLDSDDYLGCEALTGAVYTASMNPGSIVRIPVRTTLYKYSTMMQIEQKEREEALKETSSDCGENGEEISAEDGPTSVISRPKRMYDTCLGQLIPRVLLGGLRFEENYRYYSDLPFAAQLYERTDIVYAEGVYYYSRKHNDSLRFPALSQINDSERFREYCDGIRLSAGYASDKLPICVYICEFLLDRTVRPLNPKALHWSDGDLKAFCELVRDIAVPAFEYYSGTELRMLKVLRRCNVAAVKRMVQRRRRLRKLRLVLSGRNRFRRFIYERYLVKLPIRKEVTVFSAFFGRSYCDSCRGIYEYMLEHCPERKFVWVMNNDATDIPGNCIRVHTDSLKYYYYLAVAGAYVNNVRQPEWYIKRKDAVLLETWHGTPLKKLVFDLEDVFAARPVEYKKEFNRQALQWNYLLSDNRFSTDAFETAFRYPRKQILELGYPRNDILYSGNLDERAGALKEKLGLPADRKIVLYAPTWRDDEIEGVGQYGFSLKLNLKKLAKLSDRYHFILRTHYLISDRLQLDEDEKRYVTDLSKYDDIAELYMISDILITDYSSVFFDFANLNRPVLFYVYDFDKYRDTLHGFYFDMEAEVPGPLLYTEDEVIAAIEGIDDISAEYGERYEAFTKKYCYLDDGHAAERIVKEVFEK